jgi:alkylation response protein AidB-like acyl-CoA dehydrogenase
MDLSLTESQVDLKNLFVDFFAKESSIDVVRAAEPDGFDASLWKKATEMGLPVMAVPESVGGGGGSIADLTLMAIEAGRRLAPVPLVEAGVASNLLARTAEGAELVSEVAEGARLPTLALRHASGGTASLVPAGAVADVVVALDESELVASVHPPGQERYGAVPPNLGASPLADRPLSSDGSEAIVLARGSEAMDLHRRAVAEWKLLTAASLEGIRAEALRIGVEYVKERIVFGKPLGWFQVVQHRLADVSAAGDGAELLVHEAAWALDQDRDEAEQLCSMAFLFLRDLSFRTCRESLQFHGGYGYTLEYDIQLYFRRAKAWPLALGDPRRELRHLAALLFEEPTT